jgi:hypothetical protein
MPKPPTNNVMLAIRVPAEWLVEADSLASELSTPGLQLTRTDIFRQAIASGLEALRGRVRKPAKPRKG